MVVRKILETTIASGGTTATFTDSDIPNSLIRVYSTDSNIYPQTVSLTGNTLTVNYEAVSSSLGVAVEIVKQGLTINDTLTSTATDEALSANQGRALKDIIDNLGDPALTDLSDVEITSLTDGDIIQYDSDTSKFINTPLTISTNLIDLDDVDITSIQDGQVLAWDETAEKFVNVNQSGGGDSYPFINLSNEIYNSGIITSNFSSFSYTATQDCWVRIGTHGTGVATSIIYVNSVLLCGTVSSTDITFTPFFIKSGDVITLRDLAGCTYSIVAYGTR